MQFIRGLSLSGLHAWWKLEVGILILLIELKLMTFDITLSPWESSSIELQS